MGRDCLSRARRAEHRRRPDAADLRLIPPINRNQYRGPSAGPRKGEAMSISITNTAARLQRDVPATEGRIDDELVAMSRSEERRVGEEWVRSCRSRWSPDT